MTSTDPTTRLRQAATTIRDKATRAIHEDRATWTTGHTLGSKTPVVLDHPEQPSVLIETYAARLEAVNGYLALVGPATGIAVAEVLDQAVVRINAARKAAAEIWDADNPEHQADVEEFMAQRIKSLAPALAVADAILGAPG